MKQGAGIVPEVHGKILFSNRAIYDQLLDLEEGGTRENTLHASNAGQPAIACPTPACETARI